jgi:hypothetical protein
VDIARIVRKGTLVGAILLLGAGGGALAPATLSRIAPEMITALAVLSAFLIQLMFLLATALHPGRLKAVQIEQVARRLEHDQRHVTIVFGANVLAIILLLVVSATHIVDGTALSQALLDDLAAGNRALAGLAGIACSYCALGTWRIMSALHSLQLLRHEILIREAQEREAEARNAIADRVAYVPPPPDASSYGRRYERTAP